MSRLVAVVVLASIVAAAPRAGAAEFVLFGRALRLDVTESMFLNWHGDNGQPDPTQQEYVELLSRLNVQLSTGRWLLAARFDTGAWTPTPVVGDRIDNPSCPSPSSTGYLAGADPCVVHANDSRLLNHFQNNPFYLEKLSLSYGGRDLEVTVGDYYLTLGHGLVLSIHKLDELGIDTTIRGAKVQLHKGDFGAVAAVGWTNIQNLDEATTYYTNLSYTLPVQANTPRTDCLWLVVGCADLVSALHADYRVWRTRIGGQAMLGEQYNTLPGSADHEHFRGGFSVDAPRLTDWLAVYAEYARREDLTKFSTDKGGDGDAFYAAATAYTRRAVVLLELKDYSSYVPWSVTPDSSKSPVAATLVYQQPPTLERVITQLANNTDVIAGRGRLDVRLGDEALVFGSLEIGQDAPSAGMTDFLVDAYAGAELRWNEGRSHFFPFFGYRNESDTRSGSTVENLYAVEWDGAQALAHGWSVETQGLIWFRDKPQPSPDYHPWTEGNVYVSLKKTPYLVAVAGYEFTTEAPQALNQHNFFNGSVQWNITPATSLRVFAGGNRPGLKCISGVCRVFPAFEGARLELVLRI